MIGVAVGLMPIAACASSEDPSATPTLVHSTTAGGAGMTDQIAASLESTSPTIADAVRAKDTQITSVDAAAHADWEIVDVLPAGTSTLGDGSWASGTAVAEGARVTSAEQAEELAAVRAGATRDMSKGYSRVDSIDDVRFLPQPSDEDSDRIRTLRRAYRDDITAASASGNGPWTMRLWTVTDRDLVRHDVRVATDGAITNSPVVMAKDVPVSHTI